MFPHARHLLTRIADTARKERSLRDEATVRELLGQWQSGGEPAIAYRDGKIIGLTLADIPVGSVAPIVVPLAQKPEA